MNDPEKDMREWAYKAIGKVLVDGSTCRSCGAKYPIAEAVHVYMKDGKPHRVARVDTPDKTTGQWKRHYGFPEVKCQACFESDTDF